MGDARYLRHIYDKGDPGAGLVQVARLDYGGEHLFRQLAGMTVKTSSFSGSMGMPKNIWRS